LLDPNNRVRSGIRAANAFKSRPIAEQKAIFAGFQPIFERFDGFRTTAMMSIADLREIADTHEIGVHSWEHASMSMETDAYLADDAKRCQSWYRNTFNRLPRIYAFPNGMIRPGQADVVRAAGYPQVLLTGEAFSRADDWQYRRFTFHAENMAEARLRAVGTLCRPHAATTRLSDDARLVSPAE
jgi:peptidoglycan/xylan/chitin deacetylase (PgdA/CDA1 family)